MPSNKPMIGVRVDEDLKAAVEKAARADHRTPSAWARIAFEEKLARDKPKGRGA